MRTIIRFQSQNRVANLINRNWIICDVILWNLYPCATTTRLTYAVTNQNKVSTHVCNWHVFIGGWSRKGYRSTIDKSKHTFAQTTNNLLELFDSSTGIILTSPTNEGTKAEYRLPKWITEPPTTHYDAIATTTATISVDHTHHCQHHHERCVRSDTTTDRDTLWTTTVHRNHAHAATNATDTIGATNALCILTPVLHNASSQYES